MMKFHKLLLLLLLPLTATSISYAENLLINGDFEKGSKAWKGDRKIKNDKEAKNKYAILKIDNKEPVNFSQEFDNGAKSGSYNVTFDYRTSKNYKSVGFNINMRIPGNVMWYKQEPLPESPEWERVNFLFHHDKSSEEKIIIFEIMAGKGQIEFDNISLEFIN